MLNGTVSSNGASTTVTFEYGLTASYGSTIAATQSPLAAGASNNAVSASISGLDCGTLYHFRVRAVNSEGTSYGNDLTFTTAECGGCSFGDIFTDDFNRADGDPGTLWATSTNSGSFGTPRIYNQRLRLTDATGNNAGAATLLRLFPGAGNKVVVEFDHFAYGGNGADGIGVTFSDASVTPYPGAYGGSLGYAQKTGIDGFAGGWLGIGIDEYGNYSNPTEGRIDGPGFRVDSVAVRGSGSGESGYSYHAGTSANLNPQVDNNGSANPPHNYRITVDHSNGTNAWVSVERDTGSGHVALIPPYDAKAKAGQVAVPENWFISYTGSTGGSTNIHELDNLRVCATRSVEYNSQVDHFRFYYDSPAPACANQDIRVRACKDPTCTETVSGLITATFTSGQTFTFRSGDTLSFNYAGTNTVGATSSNPPLKPLSQAKCFTPGGTPRANCSISVTGSGFTISIPNHVSATSQAGTVRAQNASCQVALANSTRTINLWSTYADPADNPADASVTINGTTIAKASPGTGVSLSFNSSGIANINVVYPDAGAMRLNASCASAICGTAMTGNGNFVARPARFVISDIRCASPDAANCGAGALAMPTPGDNPAASSAYDSTFIRAGHPFNVTVAAVNANGDITPNFGRESSPESVKLSNDGATDDSGNPNLIAPAGGNNVPLYTPTWQGNMYYAPGQLVQPNTFNGHVYQATVGGISAGTEPAPWPVTGGTITDGGVTWKNVGARLDYADPAFIFNSVGTFSSGIATGTYLWNEVGIIKMTARVLDGDYLGAGDIIGDTSDFVGRFYPHHLALASFGITDRSTMACAIAPGFTYMDEPFRATFSLTAKSVSDSTTANYFGDFAQFEHTSVANFGAGAIDTDASTTMSPRLAVSNPLQISPWAFDDGISSSGTSIFSLDFSVARTASGDGPYTALTVGVAPQDDDGIALAVYNLDVDNDDSDDRSLLGSTRVQHGRVRLGNAYGSELVDLKVPLFAEYFDGTSFVTNTADICTTGVTLNLTEVDASDGLVPAEVCAWDTEAPGDSSIGCAAVGAANLQYQAPPDLGGQEGDFNLWLKAPGVGNTGSVNITATVPAWLRYDWDGDGAHDNDPTARVTFGIFGGSPRHIYLRERY
jgi:MSHA biogenesis protein MshQ